MKATQSYYYCSLRQRRGYQTLSVQCMSLLFRAKKEQLTPLVVHNITPDEADGDDTDGNYTHKTHVMHARTY